MPYVKQDPEQKKKMDELVKAIDSAIDDAVKLSEETKIPFHAADGMYVPHSLDEIGEDEHEDDPGYEYVSTAETGWVSSSYHC